MAETFRAGPLDITVWEDAFRAAILVRVVSFALVGQKNRMSPRAGSAVIVMLTGASIRRGERLHPVIIRCLGTNRIGP